MTHPPLATRRAGEDVGHLELRLLAGRHKGGAVLENCLEVKQTLTNPRVFVPKERQHWPVHKYSWFTAVSSTRAPQMPAGTWMDKHITEFHTMESHSAIERTNYGRQQQHRWVGKAHAKWGRPDAQVAHCVSPAIGQSLQGGTAKAEDITRTASHGDGRGGWPQRGSRKHFQKRSVSWCNHGYVTGDICSNLTCMTKKGEYYYM